MTYQNINKLNTFLLWQKRTDIMKYILSLNTNNNFMSLVHNSSTTDDVKGRV